MPRRQLKEDDDSDGDIGMVGTDDDSNVNDSESQFSSGSENEDNTDESESNSDYGSNQRKGKRRLGRGGSQRGRNGSGRGRGARGRGRGAKFSQSQRDNENNNGPAMNSEEFDNKIQSDILRYIILSHTNDKLIKRADLNRLIFEPNNCKQQASRYIDEARQILLANFGWNLVPNKSQSGSGTYHLVLQEFEIFEDPQIESIKMKIISKICNDDNETLEKKALLTVILGCIVLQGGTMRKDELIQQVTDKLDTTNFGTTPEKLVVKLNKQKWITIEKDVEGTEIYKLGPRCDVEFTPPDIYRCVYKLVHERLPSHNDAALQRIIKDFNIKKNEMVNNSINNRIRNKKKGGASQIHSQSQSQM